MIKEILIILAELNNRIKCMDDSANADFYTLMDAKIKNLQNISDKILHSLTEIEKKLNP